MNNLSFLDLLTIMSFVVGIENLEINIKQSNQLDEHLSKQDKELLSKIIEQNEQIIKLLEKRNDRT